MKKNTVSKNNVILNVISPIGLNYQINSLIIEENTGKIYGIFRYPTKPDYGWLSKLTNIPGTVSSFHFKPVNNGDFVDALNRNISFEREVEKTTKDTLSRQRAIGYHNDSNNNLKHSNQQNI
ncbi:MAG: uncharacterized protein K0S61_1043 [Anaerocolumna sp.]|jgi:hypothetical protein|nr:uncharacterized protein [Anaerocolumna sp.]